MHTLTCPRLTMLPRSSLARSNSLSAMLGSSRIRLVVRLSNVAPERIRHGQLDVDAARRDRALEPLRIELLKLARAHQRGERFIDQRLERRIVLAHHQRVGVGWIRLV